MKYKLFLLALLITGGVSAQSLFKSLPKPAYVQQAARTHQITFNIPPGDTTVYLGFRLTGPTVLYALPGSAVFTGVGISYEHDTYQPSTQKFYTDWSVAVQAFAGGQFAPASVSGVTAVGLSVSFFNKLVTLGVLYNLTTSKFMGGVGPTVSTNN